MPLSSLGGFTTGEAELRASHLQRAMNHTIHLTTSKKDQKVRNTSPNVQKGGAKNGTHQYLHSFSFIFHISATSYFYIEAAKSPLWSFLLGHHQWQWPSTRSSTWRGAMPRHTQKPNLSPFERIPSRKLTYPTWGKGKSSSKCHFLGIC